MDAFKHLLNEGEKAEKLDLSGWINLENLVGPGDEIIVYYYNTIPALFDIPIRAIVHGVSSAKTLALEILTEGAKDPHGHVWSRFPQGWLDVMWQTYLIGPETVNPRTLTLVRAPNQEHMLQGPFTVDVEKETDLHWFGWSEDAPMYKRVWEKKNWRIKA